MQYSSSRAADWSLGRPSWGLAVPDECVSHDIHVVAQAEIHKGVGRAEIVAVRAFPRVNERPLQVVLRGNLVELVLGEGNVLLDLFRGPADVVGPDRSAVAMVRLMAAPT